MKLKYKSFPNTLNKITNQSNTGTFFCDKCEQMIYGGIQYETRNNNFQCEDCHVEPSGYDMHEYEYLNI